jgi:hypothetical protein
MNDVSDYADWMRAAADDLELTAQPLYLVVADQLRVEADRWDDHMATLTGLCGNCTEGRCAGHGEFTADSDGCGAPVLVDGERIPDEWDADVCVCFDTPLAIAAAVLIGPASNYRRPAAVAS